MQDKPARSTGTGGWFAPVQLVEIAGSRRQPASPILETHCVVQYVINMGDESVKSNHFGSGLPTTFRWRVDRFIWLSRRPSAAADCPSQDSAVFNAFYFASSASVKKDSHV
jgi:hypothetical protein|tara:strand:+ start:120 stop:452 length:333 start_codon:yes stop_codon:yes gene_type:complete